MAGLGERIDENEINRIIQECDRDGDNALDFEEFVTAVTGYFGNNHYKKREIEYKLRNDFKTTYSNNKRRS